MSQIKLTPDMPIDKNKSGRMDRRRDWVKRRVMVHAAPSETELTKCVPYLRTNSVNGNIVVFVADGNAAIA